MSTELPRRQRATGTRAKICIVASEYNEQYTQALVENCSEELKTVLPSVRLEIIRVPGAFEIPVSIKSVLSRSPENVLMPWWLWGSSCAAAQTTRTLSAPPLPRP